MTLKPLTLAVASLLTASTLWATPPSLLTTTPLARATAGPDTRIDIKTHPNTSNDVAVVQITAQPGGNSGWHSHGGEATVVVRAGVVAIYDADDPTCTPHHVSAGEVFTEEPGHVHMVRNVGSVPYELFATFVVPAGAALRTDEPDPGNCSF
jgi:quercetin dioxygenase-like cupin family protein